MSFVPGLNLGIVLGVFVVLAPLLATVAAGQDSSEDDVLCVHQTIYPETADPQQSSFSTELAVLIQNYEGLTCLDEDLIVRGRA